VGTDAIAQDHGSTRIIRLNRPDKGNGMAGSLLEDLIAHAEAAVRDDSLRVIVTTGVGRTYSVGADFDDLAMIDGADLVEVVNSGAVGGVEAMRVQSRQQRQLDSLGIGRWVLRFWDLDKPTIAAINGGAAGGGFALALLHDFRIMSSSARINPGFARLGLGPEMGAGWMLPRLVGWSTARDLLYRCPTLAADEALEMGLVDEVVEPARLEQRALEYASELAVHPPLGVRATKRVLAASA
jgi:2-(1,2-epoxy-1,2-dihydrophenyl)acetyl-CoA isomerase